MYVLSYVLAILCIGRASKEKRGSRERSKAMCLRNELKAQREGSSERRRRERWALGLLFLHFLRALGAVLFRCGLIQYIVVCTQYAVRTGLSPYLHGECPYQPVDARKGDSAGDRPSQATVSQHKSNKMKLNLQNLARMLLCPMLHTILLQHGAASSRL
jgi:hypothetical protein